MLQVYTENVDKSKIGESLNNDLCQKRDFITVQDIE